MLKSLKNTFVQMQIWKIKLFVRELDCSLKYQDNWQEIQKYGVQYAILWKKLVKIIRTVHLI